MKRSIKQIIGISTIATSIFLGGCMFTPTSEVLPAIPDYGPYIKSSDTIEGLPVLRKLEGSGLAADRTDHLNLYFTPAATGVCNHYNVENGKAVLEDIAGQFKLQAAEQGIGQAVATVNGETYWLRMVAQEGKVYRCRLEGSNMVDEEMLTLLPSQGVKDAVGLLAADWLNRGVLDLALIVVQAPVCCGPCSDLPSGNLLKVILYKNDGQGNFIRYGKLLDIELHDKATKFGAAAVDYDNDGDTDLLFKEANKDFVRVYKNTSLGF